MTKRTLEIILIGSFILIVLFLLAVKLNHR
jgi:hypothetical protein